MELRGIQAVQVVKPSEARRTTSVAETWLDLELKPLSVEPNEGEHRHSQDEAEPFEDVEDFAVIEVSDPEEERPQLAGTNHVDLLA